MKSAGHPILTSSTCAPPPCPAPVPRPPTPPPCPSPLPPPPCPALCPSPQPLAGTSTGVTYSGVPRQPPVVAAAGAAALKRNPPAPPPTPPAKKRIPQITTVDLDAEDKVSDDGDDDVFMSAPPSAQRNASKPPQRAASAAAMTANRATAAFDALDDDDGFLEELNERLNGPRAWQPPPPSRGTRSASVAGQLQPRGALLSRSAPQPPPLPPRRPVPVATPEPPTRRPALAPGEFPHYAVEKITICNAVVNQQPNEQLVLTLTLDAIDIKGLIEPIRMHYKMLSICEVGGHGADALHRPLHAVPWS